MVECEASCNGPWIYPKKFTRSRICKSVQEPQKSARGSAKVRPDSKLRGSRRQNSFQFLAEEEEEEEEEKEEESLGSLVVKKKKKRKKKKKKKKKRKLDGGAASNFFIAASNFFITTSNFFEEPLKAWGGEREITNTSRCETGTEKGENGGGM
jgi:predicted AAA+ superfamily ATPase